MRAHSRLHSRPRDATSGARASTLLSARRAGNVSVPRINESLYPLPLAPFEAMMLYDDWPEYPMSAGAVFSFDGSVNRPAMETAVALASERHPLINSHIRKTGIRKWSWVPARDRVYVRWIDEGPATEFAACHRYNLESEVGARVWVREVDNRAHMYFEFHHACCDGAGGLGFAEDVLGYYAVCVDRGDLNRNIPPPLENSLLTARSKFPRPGRSAALRCRTALSDVATTWRLLTRRPQPIAQRAGPRPSSGDLWQTKRYVTRRFDRDVLQRLRRSAAARGATLNDLLTRDLFLTIQEWNSSLGNRSSNGTLRIVIPVNLRTRGDLRMPAANRMSYAFVGRRGKQLCNPDQLLGSLSAESTWIRRSCLPLGLLQKLALLDELRIGLPLVFHPNRCLATAAFSNLGDPTRRFRIRFPRRDGMVMVGDLRMTGFSGTTALRPLTRAGLFFNTYGSRLTISARFDPVHFSVADATAFLDLYATQIGATPIAQDDHLLRAA